MKYNLLIKELAREEISNAFLYYESQQKNLGYKLLDAIEASLESILKNPLGYRLRNKYFRSKMVYPFPYCLVFEVISNEVIVHQFFNSKQSPSKFIKKK